MKKVPVLGIAGALLVLAAACQSAPQPAAQEALPAQPATEAPASSQENQAPAPTIDPLEQEPVAPVEQEPAPTVEVRKGLAATDPATVNLANGTPTLVEFFAFW